METRPTRRRTAAERAADALATFRARVEQRGGTVLERGWLGVRVPHRVRCAAGHEVTARPDTLAAGKGFCLPCAGRDAGTAWAAFQARVVELGGTVLEPAWLGAQTPHRVRCAAGHETTTRPGGVQQGRGICRTCAGLDPAATEAAFRARVAELGGTVLEPNWLGNGTPHRVRCAAGHETVKRPTGLLYREEGLCRTCAGQDPAVAWAAFQARVVELGGAVLEPAWLGAQTPHRVRCAAGHETVPRPANIQQGGGLCRVCAHRVWDVFYVVSGEELQRVKFGITSGDPRPRLQDHAADGYTTLVRLLCRLPEGRALELERNVKATLRLARVAPARGREHFPTHALPVILDVVDNA